MQHFLDSVAMLMLYQT